MWIAGDEEADLSGCIDFDGFRHLFCGHGLDPDLEACIDVLTTVCTYCSCVGAPISGGDGHGPPTADMIDLYFGWQERILMTVAPS